MRARSTRNRRPAASPARTAPARRSSLTAPMPRYVPAGRPGRIAARIVGAGMILGGLFALARGVRTRGFGDGPLALALYQAHDELYLPLKGYTYELFFPGSLVWYGLAASIFALWLGFYLSDRSLVRRPHTALLRRLVGAASLRPVLVGVARLLLRLGLPPELLRMAAEHERDLAALRVGAGGGGEGRLVALTRLLIDLAALRPDDRPSVLKAACDWQAATLLLHVRGHPAARRLAPHIVPACARALRKAGLSPVDALATQPPGLDPTSCLTDVLRLALVAGASPATIGADDDPRFAIAADASGLARSMAWAAERRREQVDLLRARLEQLIARPTAQAGAEATQGFIADAAPTELPALGRLALGAALAAAYAARSGDLAQGAVESVEALDIAIACVGPDAPPHMQDVMRRASAWLGELPTPADRQLAASLDLDRAAELRLAWDSLADAAGPLRRADLALLDARSADRFRAGGPGYDTNLLDLPPEANR